MKIRLVRAELFHVDRRTDGLEEANSRFSLNFANATKKSFPIQYSQICERKFSVGKFAGFEILPNDV